MGLKDNQLFSMERIKVAKNQGRTDTCQSSFGSFFVESTLVNSFWLSSRRVGSHCSSFGARDRFCVQVGSLVVFGLRWFVGYPAPPPSTHLALVCARLCLYVLAVVVW